MIRRTLALGVGLSIVVFVGSAPGTRATDVSSELTVVDPDTIQFRADTEIHAMAFDAALNLAYTNRQDMGYPWLDLASKTLEIRTATDPGNRAAAAALDDLRSYGLNVQITQAKTSLADLDTLGDDATHLLDLGVPHAELVWMTEPDQRTNRVVITVSSPDPELLAAIAARYGTDRVEIRVERGGPASTAANRDSDSPLYWGGAFWSSPHWNCTTGFAWNAGGQSSMLTAAHCISTGGSASYPAHPNAGSVRSGYEENWSDSNGTQYYTGQSVYRGDVALIRYSPDGSGPYIYSGAPHTGTAKAVAAMSSRWAQFGDAVCINGVTTGEWCGMVTDTGTNVWYLINGFDVWARHVNIAQAVGNTCPTHGDSGAPVYQKRSDGKVTAFGIFSGSAPLVVSCATYYTDIWDAYYGLPGVLKTTG